MNYSKYSLIVIFRPDYEPAAVDTLRDLVEASNGETIRVDNEGVKRLTYPIVSFGVEYTRGCYVGSTIKLPDFKERSLGDEIRKFPTVLRYLLVKVKD